MESIVDLFGAYPSSAILAQTDRVIAWRSQVDGRNYLVKNWQPIQLGDEREEAPRLLRFCEAAEDLILAELPGLAVIKDVAFLGDSLVLVQEHIDARNLVDDLDGRCTDMGGREYRFALYREANKVRDWPARRRASSRNLKAPQHSGNGWPVKTRALPC